MQSALRLIYPPQCLSCGDLVADEGALCGGCWSDTQFVTGAMCDCCGVPLPGQDGGHKLLCDTCMTETREWSRGRSALVYGGQARSMVLGFKHGDRLDLARSFAGWMVGAAMDILRPDTLLVPVPLHRTRLLRRKYNQSALLAREMARTSGNGYCLDALVRVRPTDSLDALGRADREHILRGAIEPHPRRGDLMADRHVMLVDDVFTTGATLSACARAAYAAGAHDVCVMTLARVAPNA